jgi:hypothetical protein
VGIVKEALRAAGRPITSANLAKIFAEKYPENTANVSMEDLQRTAAASLSHVFKKSSVVKRRKEGRYYHYWLAKAPKKKG